MDDPAHSVRDGLSVWRGSGLLDYTPVKPRLPVVEEFITQTGPGRFAVDAAIVSAADVTLVRLRIKPPAVGVTVLDPAYTGFIIPVRWKGDYRINGEAVRSSAMYMPAGTEEFYIRSQDRDFIGVGLRRDHIIETVAALRGIGPEDMALNDRAIELPPVGAAKLRRRLAAIVQECCGDDQRDGSSHAPQDIANEIFGQITDAYLYGSRGAACKACRLQAPERIVRRAEERFAAAEGEPVSLADLCAAAGVGKSALYLAFESTVGEPPLAYFRKRRLTQARSELLRSAPRRAAVKRAALGVGFTELGRFSVEYRRMFGESPSATLNRAPA